MARVWTLLSLTCVIANPAIAQSTAPLQLKCDVGPITKTYGNAQWLVYSCNDGKSIVILTRPGNPGAPFYFLVHPSAEGYQIEGEGTGSKAVTDAAFADISKLTEREITTLVELTKHPQDSN